MTMPAGSGSGYSGGPLAGRPAVSGMAITSMILGIVGIVTGCLGIGLILGLVGVVLGIIALMGINRNPDLYSGKGFAIAGIVTGVLSLIVPIPILIAILLPSLGRAREMANRSACAGNVRMIMQAMVVYANDNNNRLPAVLPPVTPGDYTGDHCNGAGNVGEVAAAGSSTSVNDAIGAMYNSGGRPTAVNQAGNVMANEWLLVLRGYAGPKQFLCKSDKYASAAGAEMTSGGIYHQNFNSGTGVLCLNPMLFAPMKLAQY